MLPGRALMIAGPLAIFAFFVWEPSQTIRNFEFLFFFAPLWIPFVLGRFTIQRFVQWRRSEFTTEQATLLLELRLPRDTRKSPLAMEPVFSSLNIASGEGTWYKRYILGRTRPWWSFEIASIGGQVRFYVWTRHRFRRPFESFMYAQYPGIEIVEATDYTRLIEPTHPPYEMWAIEYAHTSPDPYPIKTYADYIEPSKPLPKPEEQVDPLSQVIELLGSISPTEQVWFQMIIRATKAEKYWGKKTKDGKNWTWKDEGKELVAKIREDVTIKTEYVDPVTGVKQIRAGFPNPTKGQSDTMAAIERNIGKPAFDVGMRTIYCAHKEAYHKGMGASLANLLKPFSSEQFNGFKPAPRWSEHYNDYPWEDPGGHHLAHAMHEVLEMYRRRAFFHPPYRGAWMIMSTEELASIYHIPSSSVATPSLPRMQSSTAGAPSNLPT